MKREILFKARRVDNGEWIEGDLIEYPERVVCDVRSNIVTYSDMGFMRMNAVHPETVGQLWMPTLGVRLFGGDTFTAICSPSGMGLKSAIRRECKVTESNSGHSVSVWYADEWWAYGYMNYSTVEITGNIHDKKK